MGTENTAAEMCRQHIRFLRFLDPKFVPWVESFTILLILIISVTMEIAVDENFLLDVQAQSSEKENEESKGDRSSTHESASSNEDNGACSATSVSATQEVKSKPTPGTPCEPSRLWNKRRRAQRFALATTLQATNTLLFAISVTTLLARPYCNASAPMGPASGAGISTSGAVASWLLFILLTAVPFASASQAWLWVVMDFILARWNRNVPERIVMLPWLIFWGLLAVFAAAGLCWLWIVGWLLFKFGMLWVGKEVEEADMEKGDEEDDADAETICGVEDGQKEGKAADDQFNG